MTKDELDRYQAMMQTRCDGYRIILPSSIERGVKLPKEDCKCP